MSMDMSYDREVRDSSDSVAPLASDLARFCRGRPLAAETETRISVEPEQDAGYGLGGKRGRGRTLVRRVRGEPFDEALCAIAPIWAHPLLLQTLFVGAFVGFAVDRPQTKTQLDRYGRCCFLASTDCWQRPANMTAQWEQIRLISQSLAGSIGRYLRFRTSRPGFPDGIESWQP